MKHVHKVHSSMAMHVQSVHPVAGNAKTPVQHAYHAYQVYIYINQHVYQVAQHHLLSITNINSNV